MLNTLKLTLVLLFLTSSLSFSSTLTVCTSGCGYTSLQAAMNAASDGDVILLNVTGTFTEKNIIIPEKNLTIQGLGRTTTILQSAATRASGSGGRIFTYNNPSGAGGNTFTVKDMTIQYAIAPLTDLGGGQSQSIGGVLYVPGGTPGPKGFIVTFDNVKLYANETTGGNANNSGGACVYVSATGSASPYNAQLTFTNCIFDDNKVANSAGSSLSDGPGFNLLANGLGGKLTIDNCSITNNSGYTRGGFIYCGSTWNITVKNSKISNNTCRNGDGGVFNGRSGTWTIENCTFKSNSAVFVSSVNGNNGYGGVFLGKGATFKNCTFYNNSAVKGGAIMRTSNGTDATSIINCTFYGNSASSTGKTIQIGTSSSTNYNLDLINTIITNGSGSASSEIHFVVPYSQFRTNLKNYCNSISTENGTPGSTPTFDFTSGNTTLAIASTPADNGSGLETMALSSNSTLINAGTTTSTANYEIPIKDERNYSRTDAGVDVGSYDYNGIVDDQIAPSISYTDLTNTDATSDRTLSATITDANGVYNFAQTSDLRPRIYFKKNSGSWNSSVGILSSGTGRSGSWNFSISASTMGGVTNGDIISYYVIAQDVSTTSNIISEPNGASATNVNIISSAPGTPSSYTIGASSPTVATTGTLSTFSSCSGTVSTSQSFTVSGTNLTNDIVVTPPAGYEVSTTSGSGYASTVTLTQASGTISSTTIYARLTSSASGTPSGNIVCSSTGSTSQNVAVTGTINLLPTITLGSNPSVSNGTTSASLTYSATTSIPNQYQISWSAGAIIGGFTNVSLTSLPSSPISLTAPSNPGAGSYTGTLIVKNTTTGCSSTGSTIGVTITAASTPGVTEYFDAFTLNNTSFTNVNTGHTFTLTNHLRIGSTGGNDGVNSNTPATAAVGNGSSKYIDNVPGTGANTSNSIKTTNGAQFTMKALYIYPSSYAAGDYPTTSGSVTFNGKLAGSVVYTITKNTFTPTNASSNYQGFTFIDFASGTDNSNTSIDELEITLGGAFVYFALDNFQFAASPLTTTNAATSVTSTTVTLNGTINPINYAVSATSFDYSTSPSLASGVTNVAATPATLVSSSSNGTALANLTGLSAGTTYYYRVKAVNSNGTNAGASILSFTTTLVAPTITTTTASSVASTTASSGGNVTSNGGASVTTRGVCWSTTANPTISSSKTTDGTGTGTFTSSITGLTGGTTYHYRAYATNSAGTSYGSDLTFTTTAAGCSFPFTETFGSATTTNASSVTYNCMNYKTDGSGSSTVLENINNDFGITGLANFAGSGVNGDVFWTGSTSHNVHAFSIYPTNSTDKFKLTSLDWAVPNSGPPTVFTIKGYNSHSQVAVMSNVNVTTTSATTYGSSTNNEITATYIGASNGSGYGLHLVFTGSNWYNIDSVVFASIGNDITMGLDNIVYAVPIIVSSSPTVSTTGTLSAYSSCSGAVSTSQSFTVSGTNLTNDIVVTPPTGYEVSTSSGSGYASSVTLTQASGTVSSTTIYARLTSSASGTPSGNIVCSSTGATSQNIAVIGTVNALPTITLGSNPSVTNGTTSANLTYSATTSSPNQYSIAWLAGAIIGGFSNVSLTSLPASPISLSVPSNPGVGSYTGTLTVKNTTTGCSSTGSTMGVTVTSSFSASVGSQTNVSCFGGSNGSATITPSVGTAPYTYSWSPSGGSSATATGLTAGSYTVTVNDAASHSTTVSVTITQPSSITTSVSSLTNVSCNGGSNGSATLGTPNGGTGPYSYSWSPSGGTAITATGLTAGAYTVTVTDANACTKTQSVTITQPSAINTSTGSQTNIACNGGSNGAASVSPSGGTPNYSYSWSPSGGTTASATGLAAGTYVLTVTDANSCTKTRSFTITQPIALASSVSSLTNVSCNGLSNGAATISASGGTPSYSYSWSPSGGTAATATGLSAGAYTVTITDANSCTKTQSVTITQPSALIAGTSQNNVTTIGGSDGSATVTPSGGTPSYSYSWSPSGGTAATAIGLSVGSYIVTITDANSCTKTKTFTIIQPTNHAPTASNSSVNEVQNADYVFTASNFSYIDSDSDVLSRIQITSLPVLGTLYNDDNLNGIVDVSEIVLLNGTVSKTIIDAGKLKFKSVTNALGTPYTTFGYKVHDAIEYSVTSYTMTINVLYPTSNMSGDWITSGTWNTTVTPTSTQNARVIGNHTVVINSNITIHDLKLDIGGTIQVTGTAILTIEGDLYDGLGNFSIAPGAQVILKGNIRNNQGTVKAVNNSTNGMQIKGNIHVPQVSEG